MKLAASNEGISVGPESAACVGAAKKLVRDGWIDADERVVIYNCGAPQKYPHVLPPALRPIRTELPIDWDAISARIG